MRAWISIVLTAVMLSVSGCGFKDIDKRYFVLGIGIDKTNDDTKPYRVTLKLGIPSAKVEPGQSNRSQLISQDASTITEAVRLLKSKVDKELDFGHTKIYLFGKSLAYDDIQKPLDWFVRRRDTQMIGYVAIGEPSAEKILSTKPPSERLPANALIMSFNGEGTESSYIMTERLSDFQRRITERGKDPYMPIIQVSGESFAILRAAVMDKHRIKLELSEQETRVLNELLKKNKNFELYTKSGKDDFAMSINRFGMKYKLLNEQVNPKIRMTFHITGVAEESSRRLHSQDWSRLERVAAKQAEERFLGLLRRLRDHGLDPIGFGLRYRAMGHVSDDEWQKWLELYPKTEFDLQIHVQFVGTGSVK
ncbi:Ger(x)C family spore germination protein [Paenibacillus sp. NPDC056579]|uniref:Ger(x)C family spore germination protein n=1 Tax=Paenibacillus sp. NPDC056579 TaxID=3345871 RepID=UPI0036B29A04